jgi:hypothetical protein
MTNELLTHIKKYAPFVFLDRDDADDEALGRALSQVVMNWARLDYALYLVLRAKDHEKAADWMQALLKPHVLGQRVEIVRKELAGIAAADDEFGKLLKDSFNLIDDLREKRNLLVHGLWHREDRETFLITPMQLDEKGQFDTPRPLKRSEIYDLSRQLQTVIEQLALVRAKVRFQSAGDENLLPTSRASRKS